VRSVQGDPVAGFLRTSRLRAFLLSAAVAKERRMSGLKDGFVRGPRCDPSARAPVQFAPQPTRIEFYAGGVWALRITKDRVEGNPDVPADDAAKAIIAAMDSQIKALR
jgi:hypothetical protein